MSDLRTKCHKEVTVNEHVLCYQIYTHEEERDRVCVRPTVCVCVCVCGKLVALNPVPLFDRNSVVAFFVDNIRPIASWSLCFDAFARKCVYIGELIFG